MPSTETDRLSGLSTSVAVKAPAVASTTANITLSGLQTVDSVVLVADDRVLVKNQTAGAENGIYCVATGAWQRTQDFNGARDAVTGTLVWDINDGVFYDLATAGTIAIGTTPLTFTLASSLNLPNDFAKPEDFGAVGNGVADDTAALQAALDFLKTNNGGVLYLGANKTYATSDVLEVWRGVSIQGQGESSVIKKSLGSGTTSVNLTYDFTRLGNLVLGNANAVLFLLGPTRYNFGFLKDFVVLGDTTDPNTTTVDYGLVFDDDGASDFELSGVVFKYLKYAVICHTMFVVEIARNRYEQCLHGFHVDGGTSITYRNNYAIKCRSFGHHIKGLQYSAIFANACDCLNDPTLYTDRTIRGINYDLFALKGCSFFSNGIEASRASALWEINECAQSKFINNYAIDVSSDYTGSDDIACLEFGGSMYTCTVKHNIVVFVQNPVITGSATASKHHDYFDTVPGGLIKAGNEVGDNIFIENKADDPEVKYGFGNDVPTNMYQIRPGEIARFTSSPTLTCTTPGDLAVTYGADNLVIAQQYGDLMFVSGTLHLSTITYTTASGTCSIPLAIPLAATGKQKLPLSLIDPVITEANNNILNMGMADGATTGVIRTADDVSVLIIGEIPSGSTDVIISWNGVLRVA